MNLTIDEQIQLKENELRSLREEKKRENCKADIVIAYLHADKDKMGQVGAAINLKGEVLRMFSHAACDVKIKLKVNRETGGATIIEVDDRKLED